MHSTKDTAFALILELHKNSDISDDIFSCILQKRGIKYERNTAESQNRQGSEGGSGNES